MKIVVCGTRQFLHSLAAQIARAKLFRWTLRPRSHPHRPVLAVLGRVHPTRTRITNLRLRTTISTAMDLTMMIMTFFLTLTTVSLTLAGVANAYVKQRISTSNLSMRYTPL